MTDESSPEVMWEGRFLRALRRGRWEYASRTRGMTAVVILAEVDECWLFIDQMRVPTGRRCLELPAGLVGDEDAHATVEATARKELIEETGYEAGDIEVLGEFYSSPGMVAEGFTLVRASGLKRVGTGGGVEGEDIRVHRVPKDQAAAFIAAKRAEGLGVDVKLIMFLGFA